MLKIRPRKESAAAGSDTDSLSFMGNSESDYRPTPRATDGHSQPSSARFHPGSARAGIPASENESVSYMGNSEASSPNFGGVDRPARNSPMVYDEGASYDIAMDSPASGPVRTNDNNSVFNNHELRHLQEPRKRWEDGMYAEIDQIAADLAAAMRVDDQPVTVRVHTNEDFQDYADPLGLGTVNPATMSLMRGSDADNDKTMRLSRKKMDTVRLSTLSPTKKNSINTVSQTIHSPC